MMRCIEIVRGKFTSLNSMPVERATLTRREIEALAQWFWRGRHLDLPGGSTLDVPAAPDDDTLEGELHAWFGWAANLPRDTVSIKEIWDLLKLAVGAIEEVRTATRRAALDEAAKVALTEAALPEQNAHRTNAALAIAATIESLK